MKAVLGEYSMKRASKIVVFFPPALLGFSPWTSQDFSVLFVWAGPALCLHRGYFSGCRRNLFVLDPFSTKSSPSSSSSAWFVLDPFRRILRSISSSSSSAFMTSYSSSTSWIVRAWSIQGTSSSCVGNQTSQSSWCFQKILSIPAEDLLLTQAVAACVMYAKLCMEGSSQHGGTGSKHEELSLYCLVGYRNFRCWEERALSALLFL